MILRDARVFDGLGEVHEDAAVQFDPESGRVVSVGDPERRAADEPTYSLEGRTVVPGLVDAHVHFSLSGEASVDDVVVKSDEQLLLTEVANARRTLEGGVTGARVMGAKDLDVHVRDAIEAGEIPGPRSVANCRSVTITGGHGHHLGREVDGATDCRRAVREQVKRGADFIKFMATGGVTTPGTDPGSLAFTPEEIETIVDEAHRQGVHAATHAHGSAGVRVASDAGVDTVEHGTFLDDAAIEAMLANDVTLVPTLSAPYHIANNAERVGDDAVHKTGDVYEHHRRSFRRAIEAGVRVAGGTDAGTPFNYHGANSTEVEFMVEEGMPVVDALTAMTSTAADAVGLEGAGRLAAGSYADFLVLEADPREAVETLRDPLTVVKGGEVVAGRPLADGQVAQAVE